MRTDTCTGQTFNLGLGAPVSDAEAGNYMAGYAGGYASFQSGDGSFMVGVFGVGSLYGRVDIAASMYVNGVSQGLVSGLTGYISSLNMQYNGMFQGAMDSLFGN